MSIRSLLAPAAVAAAASLVSGTASAFNEPISFNQAGTVTITLDKAGGGYDHVLELANTQGPIGPHPIFYIADGSPGATVLGQPASGVGATASLGSVSAGEELIFRLTNVESPRLGTPGNLAGQVFTGSASGLNAQPSLPYSLVEVQSPTSVHVTMEDLFPASGSIDDFKANADVAFTLTLTTVPEPQSYAMVAAGLVMVGVALRRRRG